MLNIPDIFRMYSELEPNIDHVPFSTTIIHVPQSHGNVGVTIITNKVVLEIILISTNKIMPEFISDDNVSSHMNAL